MRTRLFASLWIKPRVDAEDALAAEFGHEGGGEQVLELVGFDAEHVGLEFSVEFDAVGDHLLGGAAGHVGLDEEDALPVDGQADVGGVVAAIGVGAFAGIEGDDLDGEVGGPLVEPHAFMEVAFGPFAEFGVERRVLFFAFEGSAAAFGAEAHEGVEVFDLGPEDGGAGVHGFLVAKVEGAGGAAVDEGGVRWGGGGEVRGQRTEVRGREETEESGVRGRGSGGEADCGAGLGGVGFLGWGVLWSF